MSHHYSGPDFGFPHGDARLDFTDLYAHVDGVYPFPAVMQTQTIETNGTSMHVRVGGRGPAVVTLHGFGTTGDMWGHLASALIEDHMIVALDLPGLGLSSKPDGGYDKKNQVADVVGVMDALDVGRAELVTHDIGIWSASQLPPPTLGA